MNRKKEEYNEELLLRMMYINHFRLYKAKELREFMPMKYPGAQDYDLTLRFSEKYKIGYIAKALYGWRISQSSSLTQGISDETASNSKQSVKDATIYVEPTDVAVRIRGKWDNHIAFGITKELFEIYDRIAGHIKSV